MVSSLRGIWSFLTWTKNNFVLHRNPEMSRKSGGCRDLLILQENLRHLLPELVDPVSMWVFSVPDLFQEVWFVHLRLENEFSIFFGKNYFLCIESFRVDFWCVHRFQLFNVCNQYVTLPSSPPRTKRIQGTIQVRLSFQIDGFLTGLSQK